MYQKLKAGDSILGNYRDNKGEKSRSVCKGTIVHNNNIDGRTTVNIRFDGEQRLTNRGEEIPYYLVEPMPEEESTKQIWEDRSTEVVQPCCQVCLVPAQMIFGKELSRTYHVWVCPNYETCKNYGKKVKFPPQYYTLLDFKVGQEVEARYITPCSSCHGRLENTWKESNRRTSDGTCKKCWGSGNEHMDRHSNSNHDNRWYDAKIFDILNHGGVECYRVRFRNRRVSTLSLDNIRHLKTTHDDEEQQADEPKQKHNSSSRSMLI